MQVEFADCFVQMLGEPLWSSLSVVFPKVDRACKCSKLESSVPPYGLISENPVEAAGFSDSARGAGDAD